MNKRHPGSMMDDQDNSQTTSNSRWSSWLYGKFQEYLKSSWVSNFAPDSSKDGLDGAAGCTRQSIGACRVSFGRPKLGVLPIYVEHGTVFSRSHSNKIQTNLSTCVINCINACVCVGSIRFTLFYIFVRVRFDCDN